MKRQIFTILLIISAFAIAIPSPGQNAQFSYHISNTNVSSIVQDNDGYIWFGTEHGLNRYNGTNYSIFYSRSGEGQLASDDIRTLVTDSDGRIWIGNECGMGYYRDGSFTWANAAVFNPVTWIGILDSDNVVAMGKDGFISFRKDDLTVVDRFFEPGTTWLRNCIVATGGEVWFTKESNGETELCILDKSLQLIHRESLGRGISVAGICERPSYSVRIATSDGILTFDGHSHSRIPTPESLADLVRGEIIRFMVPYRDNSIIVGISGKGMYSFNDTYASVVQLVPEQKLDEERYKCFVDKDGNIWLSDHRQDVMFYSERRPYTHINPWHDLTPGSDSRISNLAFDREGFL